MGIVNGFGRDLNLQEMWDLLVAEGFLLGTYFERDPTTKAQLGSQRMMG